MSKFPALWMARALMTCFGLIHATHCMSFKSSTGMVLCKTTKRPWNFAYHLFEIPCRNLMESFLQATFILSIQKQEN